MLATIDAAVEIGAWAAAITALVALASRLGAPKAVRWIGRHIAEDLDARLLGDIRVQLEELQVTQYEVRQIVGQLEPNGGRSLADKITTIIGRMDARDAECDRRHGVTITLERTAK